MPAISTLTTRQIDFTSKDFESWVVVLRSLAQSVFPQWTDFNKANIGNLLLELFAHTEDVSTYSIDQQTNEGLIAFARQRKSMIDLGKLVSYLLPGATEASVDLEFTLSGGVALSKNVIIPAGTEIEAPDVEDPQYFYTTAEAIITQGTTQITGVSSRNATPQSETFQTDGSVNQRVGLVKKPYLDDSASVQIAGDTYTVVVSLLNYGPTDKVVMPYVDENSRAWLVFGDNVNGFAPTGLGQVDYETGGGLSGNVEANTLSKINSSIYDTDGTLVQVVVRNPAEAGGGTDRMNVEEARVAIPESVVVANLVTVTEAQFEINPRGVRGVARSLVLSHDVDTSIPEYTAYVYIVPVGGGLPSTALKVEVLQEITVERPQPVGMDVFVLDPTLSIISFTATVYMDEGYTEAEVRTKIEESLESFFALTDSDGVINPQIDFGYHVKDADGLPASELPFSDMFNAVNDADGVRKLDKSTFSPGADVALGNSEFPVLGSIALVNGDTGGSF